MISIDGSTGDVFEGVARGVTEVVPEARTLLGWARDAGIAIGEPAVEARPSGGGETTSADRDEDDLPPGAAVKGYATPDAIAAALRSALDTAQGLLDALDHGQPGGARGGRLPPDGDGPGARDDAARGRRRGMGRDPGGCRAGRVPRPRPADEGHRDRVAGPRGRRRQVANDHADATYDRVVLDGLAALHADVAAWLAALDGAPRGSPVRRAPRVGGGSAAAGNGKFIASPRVDSYHGAWFELHEDLIRLAGRTREAEVSAGRA